MKGDTALLSKDQRRHFLSLMRKNAWNADSPVMRRSAHIAEGGQGRGVGEVGPAWKG